MNNKSIKRRSIASSSSTTRNPTLLPGLPPNSSNIMADSKAGYSALPRTSTAPAVVHAGGPVVEAVAVPVVTDRVEVVAPTSLPGNYQLHCDFQGCPVVVLVVRTHFAIA